MKNDHYKKIMHDAVDAAKRLPTPTRLTVTEATRLHKSINATPDPERMKDDTIFRTDGKCGARWLATCADGFRFENLAKAFNRLNRGKDGG